MRTSVKAGLMVLAILALCVFLGYLMWTFPVAL